MNFATGVGRPAVLSRRHAAVASSALAWVATLHRARRTVMAAFLMAHFHPTMGCRASSLIQPAVPRHAGGQGVGLYQVTARARLKRFILAGPFRPVFTIRRERGNDALAY